MRANTGEATAAGYTDENVSWWNPGSVSSCVRTAPPARVGRLQDGDGDARLGQPDGGGQPVGAGADDDRRVAHAATRCASWCSMLSRATSPWPQNACWAVWPARR